MINETMNEPVRPEIHNQPAAFSPASAQAFLARVEFGDLLLIFYFVVLIRQWFWGLENRAAWCVTIPLAIAFWVVYISTKGASDHPSASFWLIVALPLLFVYLLRAPFPDASFDVWSLRLFHGERGLRGFIYHPGEFFPTSAPFNPTPDMLTGIFRYLLGYRLGTIVNFLALLWTGTILEKFLRPYIFRSWMRAISVLLVLFTEHILFEINNYMPDLLALPLMLEATRLVLDSGEAKHSFRMVARVSLLVGAAVALKLSNAALIAPLVLLYAWQLISVRPFPLKPLVLNALGSILIFTVTLAPFMVWVYKLTGSPVFPVYNGYFHSPLYPPSNGWDGRWGGLGWKEILAWPILIFFEPQRTAELGVYSGRLSIAFLLAIGCILAARLVDSRTRAIGFVIVLGSGLWSLTMGYIRYGLYLEVLSGLLLIIFAAQLVRAGAHSRWRTIAATLICLIMIGQSALAGYYVSREEWSMRPTVFQEPRSALEVSKYLLRDRSIRRWLPDRERKMFDGVEVWVVSGSKTAGLLPFLNDRAPVLGVRSAGIFTMEASRRDFARTLSRYQGKKMYSIALPSDLDDAVAALHNAGLEAGPSTRLVIPFFAPPHSVEIYFFEVTSRTPQP